MNSLRKHLRRYPLALACIALIWYLCLFKPPRTRLSDIENFDKVVHALMYFGTCTVIWWEYLRSHVRLSRRRTVLWAVVCPILMSGLIELAQAYLTTTRSGDWRDFAANSIGVGLAALFSLTVLRRLIHPKP